MCVGEEEREKGCEGECDGERERERKRKEWRGGRVAELMAKWQDNKLFNSVLHTSEGDEDSEVTEGCQECCSVWDSASKPIRGDD